MASTTGTARVATHASCLPFTPALGVLGVGLKTQRNTISVPSEIPPAIPPLIALISLPDLVTPLKPVPYSKPLQALILITAKTNSACSLLKIGSPFPAGKPLIRHSAIPPHTPAKIYYKKIYQTRFCHVLFYIFSLKVFGFCPVWRLKKVPKWLWFWKPRRSDIC